MLYNIVLEKYLQKFIKYSQHLNNSYFQGCILDQRENAWLVNTKPNYKLKLNKIKLPINQKSAAV